MSFHKWSGLESGFTHEDDQIKELTKVLQRYFEQKNQVVHLLTNFYVGGEEIDATIVLSNNVIVVDLKSGSGTITGGENGDWVCNNSDGNEFVLNKNRKNPYIQAREKRWAMINYLEKRKNEIFSLQKAGQMNFEHTSSYIIFSDEVSWDKKQLPVKVHPWFDVKSINSFPEKIESIKSTFISLSPEEAWLIPTLLNLKNEDKEVDENLYDFSSDDNGVMDISKTSDKSNESVSTVIEPNDEPNDVKNDQQINEHDYSVISGTFVGIEDVDGKKTIKIKTEELSQFNVHLNSQFSNVLSDLQKLADQRLRIISKEKINVNLVNVDVVGSNIYLKDELSSYFVIEPAWLINVTALAAFDFCGRSLFNNRYSLSSQNEYMMRGSIVHEVFEKVLTDPTDNEGLKKELSDSFDGKGLDFALLGINHKEMEKEFVRPHLRALYKYRQDSNPEAPLSNLSDIQTERFIINPILGLKGKIDAVVKKGDKHRAIELKTGKSWGGNAKPGHAFQVQAYSLLMEMKLKKEEDVLDPIVVYSGDLNTQYYNSIGRDVSFNYSNKAHIMNLRNKLVLADYLFSLDYEKENPRKCSNCSQAQICHNLYKLEQQHDESNIPLFKDANMGKEYTSEEIIFFNKYNRLLTEEYRVIKETQGVYLTKNVKDRIKLGKCVVISNYQEFKDNEFILTCKNTSELRKMDRCLLSDAMGPINGECLEATILEVGAKHVRISIRAKLEFLPKYLDAYSSETAFERNYSAIYEILNNEKLQKIKNILISDELPDNNMTEVVEGLENLHSQQKKAVQLAMGLKDFLIIQGPPGTGKTLTIAHIVEKLQRNEKKIIISCYTHRAIDEVIRKISKYAPDIPIYRLGSNSGSIDDSNNILLEHKINEQEGLEKRIKTANEIINTQPVYIGTTHAWLSGRFDNIFTDKEYDVGIIDEASQVVIANALGVIRLAKKFILVGDHMQLPPVVQSEEAKGLTNTLFEILYSNPTTPDSSKVMLDIQHRMPKAISEFISKEFYDGKLDVSSEASSRYLDVSIDDSSYKEIFEPNISIALINVKTKDSDHTLNKISVPEANIIVEILRDLLNAGILPKEVGIIAPFRAQVAEIRRQIELNLFKYFNSSEDIHSIVDTVDRFQGDERDIIMFSLTLIDENIPELLQDKRRLNVAISRSKKKFIGIGNWDIADGSDTLKHLKNYVEKSEQGCLVN